MTDDTTYPLDPSLPLFAQCERFLGDRADEDLPALALAERVSEILGRTLNDIDVASSSRGQEAQIRALLYLGILGGRALRGLMAMWRLGYDLEAFVLHRRLHETSVRVQRVVHDVNGAQNAREWLSGRDHKPSRIVESRERWDFLSRAAHADYRAVESFLAAKEEVSPADILPRRDIVGANGMLAHDALEALWIASTIAKFVGRPIEDGLELTRELSDAVKRWPLGGDVDE